jgi:hypothetical protein
MKHKEAKMLLFDFFTASHGRDSVLPAHFFRRISVGACLPARVSSPNRYILGRMLPVSLRILSRADFQVAHP